MFRKQTIKSHNTFWRRTRKVKCRASMFSQIEFFALNFPCYSISNFDSKAFFRFSISGIIHFLLWAVAVFFCLFLSFFSRAVLKEGINRENRTDCFSRFAPNWERLMEQFTGNSQSFQLFSRVLFRRQEFTSSVTFCFGFLLRLIF